ncbi:MAG: deoxyribonuclease IV [Pseudomonadota bacterium]
MNPIGAHMSIAGGIEKALERIQAVGGECLQVFVKPNVQWRTGELSLEEVIRFKAEQERTGFPPVVAHASYLLNLASPDRDLRKKSILTLALELVRSARLGIEYLILHPGSHREAGEKKGIERVAKGIDRAFDQADGLKTNLLLETTAGAGTQLGCRLEQLRDIMALSRNPKKLGICLDTSHVFAAGYNIADVRGYRDFFTSFQTLIGLKRLKCVHANDSKTPLGSKVDRHEQIGRGYLGVNTFQRLLNDSHLAGIPFILETPKGKKGEKDWDKINIQLLKKLRDSAPPP